MKFDPTISLGTIITLVGFAVTIVLLYGGFVRRMVSLETKVDALWKWFESKIETMNGLKR